MFHGGEGTDLVVQWLRELAAASGSTSFSRQDYRDVSVEVVLGL